jgi:hypothetical protein
MNINELLGTFIDHEGNPIAEPARDQTLVIVAGFWSEMPVGTMQGRCAVCKRLVGYDPRSQRMLAQPGRVLLTLCRECHAVHEAWSRGDLEEFERLIEEIIAKGVFSGARHV